MLDLAQSGALGATGVVRQEQVTLDAFLGNRFGQYYRPGGSSALIQAGGISGELQ
jgi:hypothetical protein